MMKKGMVWHLHQQWSWLLAMGDLQTKQVEMVMLN